MPRRPLWVCAACCLCRLLCCVPAIVCAFALPSLDKALDFTGIVGIVLPFMLTPLLHAASSSECRALWGAARFARAENDAAYSLGALSSSAAVGASAAVGIVLLLYCIATQVLYGDS